MREKYNDNPYILAKLEKHLADLPAVLCTAEERYEQKLERKVVEAQKRDVFMNYFMSMYTHCYIHQTDTYVQFVDGECSVVSEDTIAHLLLKVMNVDQTLALRKYKLKIHILKQIKERPLLAHRPDALVLKHAYRALWPCIFESKNQAKYFLTIIGDMLLGKRGLFFFIDPSFKPFLQLLNRDLNNIFNKSIDDFKHKYYEHAYPNCRIVGGHAPATFPDLNVLNIACVAAHLSNTHTNSDGFLAQCDDAAFVNSATLVQRHTPATLVQSFMDEYTHREEGASLSYKDVYFLWRHFLREHNLPLVVSQINFKHLLGPFYNSETDTLNLATHHCVPLLNFETFWNKTMSCRRNIYYEVDEIVELYNSWCESKHLHVNRASCQSWLTGRGLVQDGKIAMFCSLWDKNADIENTLFDVSAESTYEFYVKRTKQHSKMVASASYFQEFTKNVAECVVDPPSVD
jgi:hypothetical protein